MKPNPLWLIAPAAIGTGFLLPALGYGGLNVQIIPIYGDYFHNYDFRCQYCTADPAVDWPDTPAWAEVRGYQAVPASPVSPCCAPAR